MEDWVEIIIVLLVVGGSAFGAISKKLIEAFTPKERGDSAHPPRPAPPRPRPPRPTTTPPTVRPTPPSARPRREPPPIERPTVLETILGGEIPEAIPIPTEPKRPTPKAERSGSAPPHRPTPPRRPPMPKPRHSESVPSVPPGEARRGRVISAVEDDRTKRGIRTPTAAPIDVPFGQLESAIAEEIDSAAASAGVRTSSGVALPGVGSPTPANLRQAILLCEILGPPVALRPDSEG